jgi:hypothetical protein
MKKNFVDGNDLSPQEEWIKPILKATILGKKKITCLLCAVGHVLFT